jgi:hypothetical protein
MSEETLEANGHSLLPKIRDIGSVLLDEVRISDEQYTSSENGSIDESSYYQKSSLELKRLLEK